ncbi:MAG: CYTH domain-containing protein [Spirochaetota bacterium]
MGLEIERKFLLKTTEPLQNLTGLDIRQGYLADTLLANVRVRTKADKAYLTVKSKSVGLVRKEFEYEIPVQDAEEMLTQFCQKPLIEKTRYKLDYAGCTWEIDVFAGENTGLVLAEVELATAEDTLELPDWIDREVTQDKRFYNAYLAKHPYSQWKD